LKVLLTKTLSGVATTIDVLQHGGVDEQQAPIITNQRERFSRERVVEDCSIRVSRIDGTLGTFMQGISGTTRIDMTIENEPGETLFKGIVDTKDLITQFAQETTTFNAQVAFKKFWDRASNVKINLNFTPPEKGFTFVTLEYLLKKNLTEDSTFTDYFTDVDVITGTRNRGGFSIRYYADGRRLSYLGKYKDLDPNTSVADLLRGIMKVLNLESFIDVDTGVLTFWTRRDKIRDAQHPIDDLLREDVEPEILPFGAKKFDYVYGFSTLDAVPAPRFSRFQDGSGFGPNNTDEDREFTYYVTHVIAGTETKPSAPFTLTIPKRREILPGVYALSQPFLKIDLPIIGTNERRLWRTIYTIGGQTTIGLIAKITDNSLSEYVDTSAVNAYGDDFPAENDHPVFASWISYDEAAGKWNDPIIDAQNGRNVPQGDVYNALPDFKFKSQDGTLFSSYQSTFYFLATSLTIDSQREIWLDYLRTKSLVRIGVKGSDFRVGDTAIARKTKFPETTPPTDTFIVTKATVHPLTEESELEMIPA